MAGMAKMEVSPQDEMANPLVMKMRKCSPLRDMGFLNVSCLFVLCVECSRCHPYFKEKSECT